MSAQTDLSWDAWNQQHKGQKRTGPHPRIIDGVKVHVHLIKRVKGGFRTPDGNIWGSRDDATRHMTMTAKQRAAKRAAGGARRKKRGGADLSNSSKDWSMDAVKGSYERQHRAQRQAKRDARVAQGLSPYDPVAEEDTKHVREVHSNHVIVSKGYGDNAEHFHVPYDVTPVGGFSFGAEKAVKQVFVPVEKKREMALSVVAGREIDLGKDGSKWKHGWIPLNASAVALKMHKRSGGKGDFSDLDEKTQKRLTGFTDSIRKHAISARGGNLRMGNHSVMVDGRTESFAVLHHKNESTTTYPNTESGHRSAAIQIHTENPVRAKKSTDHMAYLNKPASRAESERAKRISENEKGYAKQQAAIQNHSQMSPQDKIDAVEKMHGTGSKQHLAAKKRFGNGTSNSSEPNNGIAARLQREQERRVREATAKLNDTAKFQPGPLTRPGAVEEADAISKAAQARREAAAKKATPLYPGNVAPAGSGREKLDEELASARTKVKYAGIDYGHGSPQHMAAKKAYEDLIAKHKRDAAKKARKG